MSTCRWTGPPRSEWSASNRPIAPTTGSPAHFYVRDIGSQGPRWGLAEAIAKPNQTVPVRRETLAQRRMTPIFVLWFGWALKTGHKGGHLALLPGDCRNSQTRWRRGGDLNPRNPSEFTRSPGVRLKPGSATSPRAGSQYAICSRPPATGPLCRMPARFARRGSTVHRTSDAVRHAERDAHSARACVRETSGAVVGPVPARRQGAPRASPRARTSIPWDRCK